MTVKELLDILVAVPQNSTICMSDLEDIGGVEVTLLCEETVVVIKERG